MSKAFAPWEFCTRSTVAASPFAENILCCKIESPNQRRNKTPSTQAPHTSNCDVHILRFAVLADAHELHGCSRSLSPLARHHTCTSHTSAYTCSVSQERLQTGTSNSNLQTSRHYKDGNSRRQYTQQSTLHSAHIQA